MHGAVNYVSRHIDVLVARSGSRVDDVAVGVDRYEIGCGHLIKAQAEAVNQKMFRIRYLGRNVIPDNVGKPEHIGEPVAGCEVNSHLPLGERVTGSVFLVG